MKTAIFILLTLTWMNTWAFGQYTADFRGQNAIGKAAMLTLAPVMPITYGLQKATQYTDDKNRRKTIVALKDDAINFLDGEAMSDSLRATVDKMREKNEETAKASDERICAELAAFSLK